MRIVSLPRLAIPGSLLAVLMLVSVPASARDTGKPDPLAAQIDRGVETVSAKVVSWRRDFHEHPELSNHEYRTAKIVADHLAALGLEVRTGVANTGVVGVLRGGKPGPCVALRADMDALPVTEATGLPFASKVKTEYNGQQVGVMHACGHDVHTAMLMGVAEVLAGMRKDIPGTVKFIFQPAEEGVSTGEMAGSELMIKEGALENPRPEAIFGLHVFPDSDTGMITYTPGGAMAGSGTIEITVHGVQTHGGMPWNGVDPIVVSSQIVLGLQTIISRQANLAQAAGVITIGIIHGGVRSNIIPDRVDLIGTVRLLDPQAKDDIYARIKRTATRIAESAGATADVNIRPGLPVTFNDPALTARMVPTLERVAGKDHLAVYPPRTGSEDFSYFAREIPGLFINLGVRKPGADPATVALNHSPFFMVDESAIPLGIRALANLAVDYLRTGTK